MARLTIVIILFSCIYWTSCNNNSKSEKTNKPTDSTNKVKTVKTNIVLFDRNTILKIADKDARSVYKDLSIYRVKAELKKELWYVDYELSNPQMIGGGPHYIISATTGEILSFRYEQ